MICTVCYSNRPQAKRIPTGFPAEMGICTGCAIDMDKTLGYMALQGHGFCISLAGVLHLVDLFSGEVWPTTFPTMRELAEALEKTGDVPHEDAAAPPNPPKPSKG